MPRASSTITGFVCSLIAIGSGCATPPVTVPGLALRKVVIYRNGVGYFERGGRVQSDSVQFKVRKDEVGDFLATLAIVLSIPLAITFLQTGLVPRFPTAILATGLMILAALSFFTGLILDTVVRGRRETRRLHYLSFPAPGAE